MSLRTLMLLVLVAGGGLGWFALQRQREARRQWVIATIQASGSSVDYDGIGISRLRFRRRRLLRRLIATSDNRQRQANAAQPSNHASMFHKYPKWGTDHFMYFQRKHMK